MSSLYDKVKGLVSLSMRGEQITEDEIKRQISASVEMQRSLGRSEEIDEVVLFRDILNQMYTQQEAPSVLRDHKHVNWLPEYKASIRWNFWKRYLEYLETEKVWPFEVTSRLDSITDLTLGDIGNPAQYGQWDRRGMVVGEVQSGKTANYTGLICKAVDAGYKVIIVLAGMTNDLRSQTQKRLDTEFLGFESEVGKINQSKIGVGLISIAKRDQLIVHPLTDSAHNGDFRANKSANIQLGSDPLLLVVKKNISVLKRIHNWVANQGKKCPRTGTKTVDDIPLLLIDDEADYASVNTNKIDDDPSQINKVIRLILNVFQKRSYVGYTATPFANIFIFPDEADESKYGDDLFPKSFIYYIVPPSNYIGPVQLFGLTENPEDEKNSKGLPLVRSADDAVNIFPLLHNKKLIVDELPLSLIKAIQSFIIVCAARRARGQKNVHNSMLIHVTRFNFVQQQVINLVDHVLNHMRRMIEYNTGEQATIFFEQLKEIWIEDFVPTYQDVYRVCKDHQLFPLEWSAVKAELLNAIMKVQSVRGINGDIGGILDYENYPNGLNVIAVGGDKLSRGLTLEGLSVSYYIRPAKNYDTLLQMGRWFGYRFGYVDFCRLYTTEDLIGWYEYIAVANNELQHEFKYMQLHRLTPEDYGLKIRMHPTELNITASNKVRHGKKMRVSFSGHLAQTTIFDKNSNIHETNILETAQWLDTLPLPQKIEKRGIIWYDISANQIINFLKNYTTHPLCRQADGGLLVEYINKLIPYGELMHWTVALLSNNLATATRSNIGVHKIGLFRRTDCTPDGDLYRLKKSNILSPEDEKLDLSPEQIEEALTANINAWELGNARSKKKPLRPSGPFIRKVRAPDKGLLLIYSLDTKYLKKQFTLVPVIGFAISFPESKCGVDIGAVEYQVNTKYWRDRNGEEEDND